MNNKISFSPGEDFARKLDTEDPLRRLREAFYILPDQIYLLGNSLGLMPRQAAAGVERIVDEWRRMGIGGWLGGSPPWFYLAEKTGALAAPLVGAEADEVICTGTTTFNIHSLVGTFYQPRRERTKILATALEFPTDIYALKSQIALRGLDSGKELILVEGDEWGLVGEDKIIAALNEEVALVLLPSVFYRSGQLLDLERLTAAAHQKGIVIGFDCSHSVGAVPHHFDRWGVDFAMWCGYKYLCGGPGAPAFLYLNRRHFERVPALAGWFGSIKEKQFDLSLDFEHAPCAGGMQVSSPGIMAAASAAGAVETIRQAGIDKIREKSLRMTSYLIYLADQWLAGEPYSFRVATPRERERRGGHVALVRTHEGRRIKEALALRGVVSDFRPPDIIRLAPSPLYNTYGEIRKAIQHLREIIASGEYKKLPRKRKPIS
ncbi:MAG: kynureninase [Candidatus Krumholzibacteriota bacterium]|nr:kynureninase [Candidatus Krumholzibacteriota bacterium]